MTTIPIRDPAVPEQEDLPLVLARITCQSDPTQKCEWRRTCHRSATFAHESYEDPRVIEAGLRRGTPLKQLEDLLWQNTMREQLQNRFTVYQTIYSCQPCLLDNLIHFLNTKKEEELREMLAHMPLKGYALTLWHFLSSPTMGLITPTPPTIGTPQEFMAWIKAGIRVEWKLRK